MTKHEKKYAKKIASLKEQLQILEALQNREVQVFKKDPRKVVVECKQEPAQRIENQDIELSKKKSRLINKRNFEAFLSVNEIKAIKFSDIHYRIGQYDVWPTTTRWIRWRKEGSRTWYDLNDAGHGFELLLSRTSKPSTIEELFELR